MSKHLHSRKRLDKINKNRSDLSHIFSESLNELSLENYEKIYQEVDQKLLQHYASSVRGYHTARLELAKYVQRINRLSGSEFPVPSSPVLHERVLPQQTVETVRQGKIINLFVKRMLTYWQKHDDYTPSQCLSFTLISAILYNGLYDHHELDLFNKVILKTKKYQSFVNNNHIISLEIFNKKFGNKRIENSEFPVSYIKTIVLNDIVKCWIYRLNQQVFELLDSDIYDIEQLINVCILECFPKEKVRYQDLLKYGFYYTQFLQNSHLDQLSISILKNDIHSSSPLAYELDPYFKQFSLAQPAGSHQYQSRKSYDIQKNIEVDLAQALVDLRKAIAAKNYVEKLIQLFINLSSQSEAIKRLILWGLLRSKLTHTQLADLNHSIQTNNLLKRNLLHSDFQPVVKSSLKTMFSQFASNWIVATQNKDITTFSSDDFEELYGEILLIKGEQTRAGTQKRLSEFHRKQTLFFNAPPVNLENLIHPKICKTALISPHLFHQFIHQLQMMNDIPMQDRNMFQMIFTLGFRIGLRINETLNIFMRDLLITEDTITLTIRNNRNKNQKSYSAYRKIPIHHFMKADEFNEFKGYCLNRKRLLKEQKKSLSQPLFLKQSLDETTDSEVNALLKDTFKLIYTEQKFTYHTLRHSAFNHIYLVLTNSTLAHEFTDYSISEQLRIRYALLRNRNSQQTWYALSHFAGHLTPETTCSSYLHLMHLAITFQLNQIQSPLSKEAYFNILKSNESADYPVQQRAIHLFLFKQLTKDRYKQNDHQYVATESTSASSMLIGAPDSDFSFELIHHILSVQDDNELMLPASIPLQIAQKLRTKAQDLKTSCVNQKGSSRLFTTDFLRKSPNALVTTLPTHREDKDIIRYVQEHYASAHNEYEKQISEIFSIYLKKVNANSPEFIFELNEKRQLKKFLVFILNIFPKKYINIECSESKKEQIKYIIQDLNLKKNLSLNNQVDRIIFSFREEDGKALGVFKFVMCLMIVHHILLEE